MSNPSAPVLVADLSDALEDVRRMLDGTTTQNLLLGFASLTHQMHGAEDVRRETELRVQRDMIESEILRRTEKPVIEDPFEKSKRMAAEMVRRGESARLKSILDWLLVDRASHLEGSKLIAFNAMAGVPWPDLA